MSAHAEGDLQNNAVEEVESKLLSGPMAYYGPMAAEPTISTLLTSLVDTAAAVQLSNLNSVHIALQKLCRLNNYVFNNCRCSISPAGTPYVGAFNTK